MAHFIFRYSTTIAFTTIITTCIFHNFHILRFVITNQLILIKSLLYAISLADYDGVEQTDMLNDNIDDNVLKIILIALPKNEMRM